jgi:hypothetical protein
MGHTRSRVQSAHHNFLLQTAVLSTQRGVGLQQRRGAIAACNRRDRRVAERRHLSHQRLAARPRLGQLRGEALLRCGRGALALRCGCGGRLKVRLRTSRAAKSVLTKDM